MKAPVGDFIDISHNLSADMAAWPGDTEFQLAWTQRLDDGSCVNVSRLTLSPHSGTHVDAPLHFTADGASVDELPLSLLIGRCVVLDLGPHLPQDEDRPEITASVLELSAGDLVDGISPRVLVRTGYVFGRPFNTHFAHFSPDAADWLASRGVRLLGTDAPSVDDFDSKNMEAHRACVSRGVTILEGLNLHEVNPGTYRLIALPMKIAGAEGAPVRAVLKPR